MNRYSCENCIHNSKGSVFYRNRKCAACVVDSDNIYEGKPSNYKEKDMSVIEGNNIKKKWNILEECNEEDGTPTCWSLEINSEKYGKYVWISINCSGEYSIEIDRGSGIETLKECKSLTSAKKWVTMNLL